MIRTIPASDEHVGSGRNVTGPLQIGHDWPGTFFRGDESGGISDMLRAIARKLRAGVGQNEGISYSHYLDELADQFSACQIKGGWDAKETQTDQA